MPKARCVHRVNLTSVSYKTADLEITHVICSQIIENNSVLDTKVMGDNRLNLSVLYNSQITQMKNRRQ